MTLEPLLLNIHRHGIRDTLPIDPDDYVVSMEPRVLRGEEWLLIMTNKGREFLAQPNDAGGLNVRELNS